MHVQSPLLYRRVSRQIQAGMRQISPTQKHLQMRRISPKTRCCRLSPMVDTDLIVQTLRQHGHRVDSVISVPENAGEYEFIIDGNTLNLEEARQLLEQDEAK
jgi:hypothetical protein